VKVRRFQAGDVDAIERLNTRLQAGGATDVVYPEGAEQQREGSLRERLFLAEDGAEIRGAVWLKEQTFRIRGEDMVCGWLKYPVAESLVDARFSGVPGSLIIQCLREQPRLLALGLGGHETPLARMLKALRWTGTSVPMLVRVVRPARTLRQLAPLRRSRVRRAGAAIAAGSGLGWLGLRAFDLATRFRSGRPARRYSAEHRGELGDWADAVWLRERDRYDVVAFRDRVTAEAQLPRSADVHRLRIRRDGEDVGWVAMLRHDFSEGTPDANFGRLTVGLIADGLAAPEHAAGVIGCAFEFLASAGADIVVSNQLHDAWVAGLRANGFVGAPSNFAFYAAPRVGQLGVDWSRCHVNRGDCDGPMWYQAR
jgi:hypothetical protein